MPTMDLLAEMIAVGVMVIFVGFASAHVLVTLTDDRMSRLKLNNSTSALTVLLFTTGVATHFLCEISGLNAWYCKNGNACK